MKPRNIHLNCLHYWVSTKDEHLVQCVNCGHQKEVAVAELFDHDHAMKPEQEHREAS